MMICLRSAVQRRQGDYDTLALARGDGELSPTNDSNKQFLFSWTVRFFHSVYLTAQTGT